VSVQTHRIVNIVKHLHRIVKYISESIGNLGSDTYDSQTSLQDISYSEPFPCPTGQGSPGARSPVRPTSVHRLRPGDIDVVGALGDSLSTANGADSTNMMEVIIENRGMAWSIGGQLSWREYLTLPNILKEFNPNLVGYSFGDSLGFQLNSQFNVAEPGSISDDMPFQATVLEKRMRLDSRVDLQNDWKLVAQLLVGNNDFCSFMCVYENYTEVLDHQSEFVREMQLKRILSFAGKMTAQHLRVLQNLKRIPADCLTTLHIECPCLFGFRWTHLKENFTILMDQFQQIDMEIANSDRYSTKNDFAVVLQPFLTKSKVPEIKSKSGSTFVDLSFLAKDCFHFSQKGHALAANGLWNNMMEPVGKKSRQLGTQPFYKFLCPTEDHPFIYTSSSCHI
ncbi:hypothetical protein L9F63_007039, partial [Diploptera punctata]